MVKELKNLITQSQGTSKRSQEDCFPYFFLADIIVIVGLNTITHISHNPNPLPACSFFLTAFFIELIHCDSSGMGKRSEDWSDGC